MELKNYIYDIPDFPKPGIVFKDISPLLASPEAFNYTIEKLSKTLEGKVDCIVGLDARGFIFGSAVAYALKLPFIMVRKPGKLPGETIDVSYALEYGENTLALQKNLIKKGQRVGIVDDVLATGGTTKAAIELIETVGGEVQQISFLMSLTFLPGEKLLEKYSVNSLIQY